ncbi:hypothetical protein LAWI1_G005612 [Lachnellula willkommii]|uniref:Transcription factor domain-containing protein n=1 Tax=Lachnellula willkommii TaxID=215461 RepID=A0A559MCF8_9HELO|nr:hypothetical protein LAWI1_G005612 [Lachnellula willkommii]
MLQARLNDPDQSFAISDGTIMVVLFLASAAELMGDFAAVENHIRGLEKIVSLRGGVRALNVHNSLQVKVCRADLSYALLSGHQPLFFKTSISWDCFLADRSLIQCSHPPHDTNTHVFLKPNIDTRLHNIFRDLHAFSCISNLAYQTTRKLSPDIYNEVMISILYRLTHLSFDHNPMQEVLRISLLAVSSTIFMQRQFMDNPYAHLLNLYRNALSKLSSSTGPQLPVSLSLWMTVLLHVVECNEQSLEDGRGERLDRAVSNAGVESWPQAREMLRSVVWIDFVHDRVGKLVFEASMVRLGKSTIWDS